MNVPADRKYTTTHEWFKADGEFVTVGISQFAADELTDITFVDLPPVGTQVKAGEPLGEIESVKATAELLSAINGSIVEINAALADEPGLVNESPFDKAWMVRIKPDNASALDELMDPAAYEEHCATDSH